MGKLLLVDDSPLNRKLMKTILENEGYTADEAENGFICLEKCETEKPDLVIMDASMPKLDGWEALRLLRGKPNTKDIPVIICSGSEMDEGPEMLKKRGGQGFLLKPYRIEELISMVKEILK